MHYVICDVINYCARSYEMCEINVYDKIVIKTVGHKIVFTQIPIERMV